MAELDVLLTAAQAEAHDLTGQAVVVIDVLRATTTMTVMLERGAECVRTVAEVEEARRVASVADWLLAGERQGVAPPGFDFGNSPVQLSQADLAGRRVLLTTTNGTRTVAAAGGHGSEQPMRLPRRFPT